MLAAVSGSDVSQDIKAVAKAIFAKGVRSSNTRARIALDFLKEKKAVATRVPKMEREALAVWFAKNIPSKSTVVKRPINKIQVRRALKAILIKNIEKHPINFMYGAILDKAIKQFTGELGIKPGEPVHEEIIDIALEVLMDIRSRRRSGSSSIRKSNGRGARNYYKERKRLDETIKKIQSKTRDHVIHMKVEAILNWVNSGRMPIGEANRRADDILYYEVRPRTSRRKPHSSKRKSSSPLIRKDSSYGTKQVRPKMFHSKVMRAVDEVNAQNRIFTSFIASSGLNKAGPRNNISSHGAFAAGAVAAVVAAGLMIGIYILLKAYPLSWVALTAAGAALLTALYAGFSSLLYVSQAVRIWLSKAKAERAPPTESQRQELKRQIQAILKGIVNKEEIEVIDTTGQEGPIARADKENNRLYINLSRFTHLSPRTQKSILTHEIAHLKGHGEIKAYAIQLIGFAVASHLKEKLSKYGFMIALIPALAAITAIIPPASLGMFSSISGIIGLVLILAETAVKRSKEPNASLLRWLQFSSRLFILISGALLFSYIGGAPGKAPEFIKNLCLSNGERIAGLQAGIAALAAVLTLLTFEGARQALVRGISYVNINRLDSEGLAVQIEKFIVALKEKQYNCSHIEDFISKNKNNKKALRAMLLVLLHAKLSQTQDGDFSRKVSEYGFIGYVSLNIKETAGNLWKIYRCWLVLFWPLEAVFYLTKVLQNFFFEYSRKNYDDVRKVKEGVFDKERVKIGGISEEEQLTLLESAMAVSQEGGFRNYWIYENLAARLRAPGWYGTYIFGIKRLWLLILGQILGMPIVVRLKLWFPSLAKAIPFINTVFNEWIFKQGFPLYRSDLLRVLILQFFLDLFKHTKQLTWHILGELYQAKALRAALSEKELDHIYKTTQDSELKSLISEYLKADTSEEKKKEILVEIHSRRAEVNILALTQADKDSSLAGLHRKGLIDYGVYPSMKSLMNQRQGIGKAKAGLKYKLRAGMAAHVWNMANKLPWLLAPLNGWTLLLALAPRKVVINAITRLLRVSAQRKLYIVKLSGALNILILSF